MNIGVYHRGHLIAECKTPLEAWDKSQEWSRIFSPVEVKRVADNSSERISPDTKRA